MGKCGRGDEKTKRGEPIAACSELLTVQRPNPMATFSKLAVALHFSAGFFGFDRWAVRWMDSIYFGIKEPVYEVIEVKSHETISSKDISRRQLLKSSGV
ncbi:magnesium transporter MRS2-11 [Carex littledalei]|uniref:Magnesium transporter MRS2-11 n=1 Tax=Carex littledalei TaxID=544730 RepID=A0A833VIQ5_9POAL|nr:magnesium transporter MRS2-11 [Carex littledalei]